MTDAYKLFHRELYPKNTVTVFSNMTGRSSNHYKGKNKYFMVVFGPQGVMRTLHDQFELFFNTPKHIVLEFMKEQLNSFTGAEYALEHIAYLHDLQKLPLHVKSLPEGSRVPIGVPYFIIYNTDPKCFWLTNYLETWLSAELWPLTTNASIAAEYRELFNDYAKQTSDDPDFVWIQGHDFSMRGMFGAYASTMSGMAQLTSFAGTDTIPAYLAVQYLYDSGLNDWSNFPKGIIATSIPATEHSVQCSYHIDKVDDELAYLDAVLDTHPEGPVSIVADGFNFWDFITKTLPQRKERILSRNGKLVIRPDSGNPVDIVAGEPPALIDGYYTKERLKGAISLLYEIFGGTVNSKGFKVLDPHIGLIYGDSITLDRAEEINKRLFNKGFASTNWVAGIGSYTYQYNTRDSFGQAIKATYIEQSHHDEIHGKEIFKDPQTKGNVNKKSARGLTAVYTDELGKPYLVDRATWEQVHNCELVKIYENGTFHNPVTLQEIRKRLWK